MDAIAIPRQMTKAEQRRGLALSLAIIAREKEAVSGEAIVEVARAFDLFIAGDGAEREDGPPWKR